MKDLSKRILSMLLAISILTVMMPFEIIKASATNTSEVVSASAYIIYQSEGTYGSVCANDNGAVSIGKLQWHATRALKLLQTIVTANTAQASTILGTALYTEITTSTSWEGRAVTADEKTKISSLLNTTEGKAAQDTLATADITAYVNHGIKLGMTNPDVLVYFADLENQGGGSASARIASVAKTAAGEYAAITLLGLHTAALADSHLGTPSGQANINRRTRVYNYASSLLWQTNPPNVPSGLKAPSKTDTTVTLCWYPVTGATGYNVYNGTTLLNLTPIPFTTCVLTDLTQSTTYLITVTAVNTAGESSASPVLSVTTKTTPPDKPASLISTGKTDTTVTLQWDTISGATGYNIYFGGKNGSISSPPGKFNSTPITGNSVTVTGLSQNSIYYFEVTAVNPGGESDASDPIIVTTNITPPAQPTGLKASSKTDTAINLSWNPVTGSTGYYIYKGSVLLNSDPITATAYAVTGLTQSSAYSFTVVAENAGGVSPASTVLSAGTLPVTPVSFKAASASYNSIIINWDAVNGVTGYVVYRYNLSTKKYDRLKVTSSITFTDTNLVTGTEYTYKVRAFHTVGKVNDYGAPSTAFTAKPILAVPASPKAILASSNSINVSWDAVDGATGYVVYLYNGATKAYNRLKVTSLTTFTHTNLAAGSEYSYKVRAYRKTDTGNAYGDPSAVFKATPVPAIPGSFTAVKAGSTSVKLSWNAVGCATGYEVFRYSQSTNKYEFLKDTAYTSYTNTGLTKNIVYSYMVRAYITVNEVKVYGLFTAVKSARPS